MSVRLVLLRANDELLRVKGNLHLRVFIEEYENQLLYRLTRLELYKKNISDYSFHASRLKIWSAVLSSSEYDFRMLEEMKTCLRDAGALDSAARVISDMYAGISKAENVKTLCYSVLFYPAIRRSRFFSL